ncbi:MAG: hypothetical protein CM15mP103_06400 [Gammaproteobacteria bacterium]|nr:MAG: hypothetical protein CM15mP103_06400 [Gammaproteobacteria bacterium]
MPREKSIRRGGLARGLRLSLAGARAGGAFAVDGALKKLRGDTPMTTPCSVAKPAASPASWENSRAHTLKLVNSSLSWASTSCLHHLRERYMN